MSIKWCKRKGAVSANSSIFPRNFWDKLWDCEKAGWAGFERRNHFARLEFQVTSLTAVRLKFPG